MHISKSTQPDFTKLSVRIIPGHGLVSTCNDNENVMYSTSSFVDDVMFSRNGSYSTWHGIIGSRPSDHYFRSVCLFVDLFVQSFYRATLC